ncbi:hypothetical protein QUH71_01335 [Priestia aryabhattai]|uniref:hypothetical protein n=1 Tax=Priestia aryabhattai TaxID=412384 RepID=UPI0025A38400|nr:hypothetical protein [Priestia aryabhattai]WJN45174.1 hypothetical protein QUH71_01335 [Priestia aryabhattai]
MTRKAKIELLGKQLERMKIELEQREFSDVSTDKLIEVFSKTLIQLKQEELEVVFKGEGDALESLTASMNTVT